MPTREQLKSELASRARDDKIIRHAMFQYFYGREDTPYHHMKAKEARLAFNASLAHPKERHRLCEKFLPEYERLRMEELAETRTPEQLEDIESSNPAPTPTGLEERMRSRDLRRYARTFAGIAVFSLLAIFSNEIYNTSNPELCDYGLKGVLATSAFAAAITYAFSRRQSN